MAISQYDLLPRLNAYLEAIQSPLRLEMHGFCEAFSLLSSQNHWQSKQDICIDGVSFSTEHPEAENQIRQQFYEKFGAENDAHHLLKLITLVHNAIDDTGHNAFQSPHLNHEKLAAELLLQYLTFYQTPQRPTARFNTASPLFMTTSNRFQSSQLFFQDAFGRLRDRKTNAVFSMQPIANMGGNFKGSRWDVIHSETAKQLREKIKTTPVEQLVSDSEYQALYLAYKTAFEQAMTSYDLTQDELFTFLKPVDEGGVVVPDHPILMAGYGHAVSLYYDSNDKKYHFLDSNLMCAENQDRLHQSFTLKELIFHIRQFSLIPEKNRLSLQADPYAILGFNDELAELNVLCWGRSDVNHNEIRHHLQKNYQTLLNRQAHLKEKNGRSLDGLNAAIANYAIDSIPMLLQHPLCDPFTSVPLSFQDPKKTVCALGFALHFGFYDIALLLLKHYEKQYPKFTRKQKQLLKKELNEFKGSPLHRLKTLKHLCEVMESFEHPDKAPNLMRLHLTQIEWATLNAFLKGRYTAPHVFIKAPANKTDVLRINAFYKIQYMSTPPKMKRAWMLAATLCVLGFGACVGLTIAGFGIPAILVAATLAVLAVVGALWTIYSTHYRKYTIPKALDSKITLSLSASQTAEFQKRDADVKKNPFYKEDDETFRKAFVLTQNEDVKTATVVGSPTQIQKLRKRLKR